MILLDTNVISELMRAEPDPAVLAWVARQDRDALCTASIVQTEILYGIALFPDGRRKSGLAAAAEAMFAEEFARRVLPYDGKAARRYAELVTGRRAAGKPIEAFDALIAAARIAGTALATRDIGGFADCGIELIDPWAETAGSHRPRQ